MAGRGRHRAAEPDTGVVLVTPVPAGMGAAAASVETSVPAPGGSGRAAELPSDLPVATPPTAVLPAAVLPAVTSPSGGSSAPPTPRRADELDGLTRPIRLGDRVSRPRLPGPRGA
ncbi:hypothetical protein ACI8AC_20105 [Geodermatophilus sp. SYSU D00758]